MATSPKLVKIDAKPKTEVVPVVAAAAEEPVVEDDEDDMPKFVPEKADDSPTEEEEEVVEQIPQKTVKPTLLRRDLPAKYQAALRAAMAAPLPIEKAKQVRVKTVSYYICVSRRKPDGNNETETDLLTEAAVVVFGEHNEDKETYLKIDDEEKVSAVNLFYRAETGELSERSHLHIVYNVTHKTNVELDEDTITEAFRENLGNINISCFQYGGRLTIEAAITKRGKMVLKEEGKFNPIAKMSLSRPNPIPTPTQKAQSLKKKTQAPQTRSHNPAIYRHENARVTSLSCFGIAEDDGEYED